MNTNIEEHLDHEHIEPHDDAIGAQLNWLRAAVLGSMDGIVSTASVVLGVAATGSSMSVVLTAGVAGLLAGALSMAVGEYVSVSTQRDTEKAFLDKERNELVENPEKELDELACAYEEKGLPRETALKVAQELTAHDALSAHAEIEFGVKGEEEFTNPWHAAYASFASFTVGSLIPLFAIMLPPASIRIAVTFCAVFVALAFTGWASAHIGRSPKPVAIVRVIFGGIIAMMITYSVGKIFGVAVM